MTSTPTETRPVRLTDLGTLVVLPWSGAAADGGDLPYLPADSLGDAEGGPRAMSAAVEGLPAGNGLRVGGGLVDGTTGDRIAVSLFLEAGQAFGTMPELGARCAAPPE